MTKTTLADSLTKALVDNISEEGTELYVTDPNVNYFVSWIVRRILESEKINVIESVVNIKRYISLTKRIKSAEASLPYADKNYNNEVREISAMKKELSELIKNVIV